MNTDYFKGKLETEKTTLESELNDIGHKDPDNPTHWETVPADREEGAEFRDEIADRFEDFEEREATRTTLESRLEDVKSALERINQGTYGTCEKCGQPIEEDRLEANPAAKTCKAHMETGAGA